MTLAAPAIILTGFVTLVAVLITLGFAILVGRTRGRVKIDAPAMTGHPDLERALRIQGNTVEQIVIFLPALWLAALYFQGWWAPIIGAVWCLGRVLYAVSYGTHRQRLPGFALTVLPSVTLIVLAAIGLIGAWSVTA